MRRLIRFVLVALALLIGGTVGATPLWAAGDACSIVGKYIGSAQLVVVGTALATSHFDITFAAGEPCEPGTFVANVRLQAAGSQASIDEQLLGVYTVTDGFLFMPLPNGVLVLGEPGFCVQSQCFVIPFTAAREGTPDIRFSGVMTRAEIAKPE